MNIPDDKWKKISRILIWAACEMELDVEDYVEEKAHYVFKHGEKEGKRSMAAEIIEILVDAGETTRADLVALLGKPDNRGSISRKYPTPAVYRYGNTEYHFAPGEDGVLAHVSHHEEDD